MAVPAFRCCSFYRSKASSHISYPSSLPPPSSLPLSPPPITIPSSSLPIPAYSQFLPVIPPPPGLYSNPVVLSAYLSFPLQPHPYSTNPVALAVAFTLILTPVHVGCPSEMTFFFFFSRPFFGEVFSVLIFLQLLHPYHWFLLLPSPFPLPSLPSFPPFLP